MFENNGLDYMHELAELAKKEAATPKVAKVEEEKKEEEEVKKEEPKKQLTIIDMTAGINKATLNQFMNISNPNTDDDKRHRPLIRISSPGGSVPSMLAMIDIMSTSQVPSISISLGFNASAATPIIASSTLRLGYVSSTYMLHDMRAINDGSNQDMRNRLQYLDHSRELFTKIYMERIGLSKKELERIIQRDTYFGAVDALNLGTRGLIDGIISKQLDGHKFEVIGRSKTPIVVDLHEDDLNEVVEKLHSAPILSLVKEA